MVVGGWASIVDENINPATWVQSVTPVTGRGVNPSARRSRAAGDEYAEVVDKTMS